MKLDLQLQPTDLALSDAELVHKAEDALKKALDAVQPGLGAHTHAHEGEYLGKGGEVRAVGDLTALVDRAYQARCGRMLEDISRALLLRGSRG